MNRREVVRLALTGLSLIVLAYLPPTLPEGCEGAACLADLEEPVNIPASYEPDDDGDYACVGSDSHNWAPVGGEERTCLSCSADTRD